MMISLLKNNFLLIVLLFLGFSHVHAQELYVEDFRSENKDDLSTIQAAMDALQEQGHGSLSFDGGRNYIIETCILLPTYNLKVKGGQSYILNGNGCNITITNNKSCGFFRKPNNQNEALNKMIRYRFVISDFTFIGGAKAIELGATYGSVIQRCNFKNQKLAAIDIQFGLNTIIEHCQTVNCSYDNFILRDGEDWGGSPNNSQSNNSKISSCRVFAAKNSNSAFKILSSNGVVLENIISEGQSDINYSVYFNKQKSTTVRLFYIKNFHLEHAPIKAGLLINSTGIVDIDGLFYQLARKNEEFNLFYAYNNPQQINIKNVPHYVKGTVIRQRTTGSGVSWNFTHCNENFYKAINWRIKDKNTEEIKKELPEYFNATGYLYKVKKNY